MLIGDRAVRGRLEELLDVEVVGRADHRAARDGRDHLDPAEAAELGEAREDADVEEGRAVAASREREAELPVFLFLRHRRPEERTTIPRSAQPSLDRVMRRWAPGAMLAAGKEQVSSLQLPLQLDEPVSPELALVCPELGELARRLLPDPGWLAPVVRLEPARVRTAPLQRLVLAFFSVAVTVTPLALVLAVLPSRG